MNKPQWKQKDQYYTNKDVAKYCYDIALKKLLNFTGYDMKDVWFIEPAAGEGAFFDLMPKNRRLGVDIDPKGEDIIQDNFLTREVPDKNKIWFAISNPPFGHRLKTARDFFNRLCLFSDAIVFICPHSFCRYQNANRLVKTHRLIHQETLDENSFHTPQGKKYKIPAELSVWVKSNRGQVIRNTNELSHPDIDVCVATYGDKRCRKLLDDDNDYYILRMLRPYNINIDNENKMKENLKYIFISENKKGAIDNIKKINWREHTDNNRCTITKYDVIRTYIKLHGDGSYEIKRPMTSHPDFTIRKIRGGCKEFIDAVVKGCDLMIPCSYITKKNYIRVRREQTKEWAQSILKMDYLFIDVKNCEVLKRLCDIDWIEKGNVSQLCSIFKNDVVRAYTELYGDGSYEIEKDKTTHPDFEMIRTRYKDKRQVKRKKVSEYDFDWNLAFEGFHFVKNKSIIKDKSKIIDENDYLLFKCSKEVEDRLCSIDWDEVLKSDPMSNLHRYIIVREYTKHYGDGSYAVNKPATSHDDFDIFSAPWSDGEFHKNWTRDYDIAFKDSYFDKKKGLLFEVPDERKNEGWILVKCKNKNVIDTLLSIDWEAVSNNYIVNHIRQHIIINEYNKAKNKTSNNIDIFN